MNPFSILRLAAIDVLISPEDAPRIAQYSWHIFKAGRKQNPRILIATRINGRRVKLHRFLVGAADGVTVDHANGITLDNRRENLRVCAKHENCMNLSKMTRACTSKYKGVHFTKDKRWTAYISVNKRRIHIGSFSDEVSAAEAYDRAAIRYHGTFSRPNFPTPSDVLETQAA